MNSQEIKNRLNADIENVCRHLLPTGKRVGREWVCGDVHGSTGESLKVHLNDGKAGVWQDFATGQKGDVFDLWQTARALPFKDALSEIKSWLNIPNDDARFTNKPVKRFTPPPVNELLPLATDSAAYLYLTHDRKLLPEILTRYGVQRFISASSGEAVVFPITAPDGGNVVLLKFLAVNRPNGEKVVWASKDGQSRLFGWQAIPASARDIYICEGEIDTLTLAGWGFPALSVPSGCQSLTWIDNDFDALDRFERIFLCLDMDKPGQEAAEAIAGRLGRERCYRVELPHKDANECLLAGFDGSDFDGWAQKARTLDPAVLKPAGDFYEAVERLFWPQAGDNLGTNTPFDIPWKIRPAEVTVWTGFSGHGKSLLLMQFILNDLKQGERACIASMEIRVEKTIKILVRQHLQKEMPPDRDQFHEAMAWLNDRAWFYDRRGATNRKELLETFQYAARRYGCSRFVVDSLLFCGIAEDDYDTQKEFVCQLRDFADEFNVHVHLVAHSRKKDDETRIPGKLDVHGSHAITDIPHNGLTVWRNKAKELILQEIQAIGPTHKEWEKRLEYKKALDGSISLWKQRDGDGEEPFRYLWLNQATKTFTSERPQ